MKKKVNISFIDGGSLDATFAETEFADFLEGVATNKIASINYPGGAMHLITNNIVRITENNSEVSESD